MSFLSDDFYKELSSGYKARITPAANPPETPPTPDPGKVGDLNNNLFTNPIRGTGTPPSTGSPVFGKGKFRTPETPVRMDGDISEEEQIKKYGGVVGSPEYWKTKEKHPVLNTLPFQLNNAIFGIQYPDLRTWDKMTTRDKISHTGEQLAELPIKLALGFPSFFLKAIPNLTSFVARPIREGTLDLRKLAEAEQTNPDALVIRGKEVTRLTPLYSHVIDTYDKAKAAGHSTAVSSVAGLAAGGLEVLNNVLAAYGMITAVRSLAVPPKKLVPGEGISNTAPIQKSLNTAKAKLQAEVGPPKDGPASLYYSHPTSIEADLRSHYGVKGGRIFTRITPAGEGMVEISVVQTRGGLINKLKSKIGMGDEGAVAGKFGPEKKLESHIVKVDPGTQPVASELQPSTRVQSFPSEALPGYEKVPISRMEVENLSNIARMNNIDPNIQNTMVRVLTGKSVVGDLTKAEYIKVAKSLSSMNAGGEFNPGGQASVWSKYMGQYISPANSWMEAVQRRTGVPIFDAHLDLRNGLRFSKVAQESWFKKWDEIWGEYAQPKFEYEQRLVDAYRRGDTAVITENVKLTPKVKKDLITIAERISPEFYDVAAKEFNLPAEHFQQGYAGPDIADLGGVVPKYKTEGTIPTPDQAFFKYERKGGVMGREDNAYRLGQIYARAGAQEKFVKPVVERIKLEVEPNVPLEFRNSFSSTVQEMMGYQGQFEKMLDNVSTRFGQLTGLNVPPDAARKLNQGAFSYAYVNSLSSPGTSVRNLLTNEAFLYTKFGGEFWPQTKAAIGNKDLWKEFFDSGFSTKRGEAFGADLGTIEGGMKNTAEFLLTPTTMADNLGRFQAYVNTKLIFEDALKRYNQGKLSWSQVEAKLDLGGISPIEANRVRQALQAGDLKTGFEELARANIDETNFAYGRGESGRATFGEGGHIATFLYKWNIHAAHNMGRWLRTGQYDKLLRYYIAGKAITESLKESMGTDFTNTFGAGPVIGGKFPVSVQILLDVVKQYQTLTDDNAQAIDDAKDRLSRSLKTFGRPGGVMRKNWDDFWRSYSAGPVDAEGRYNVINERGEKAEPNPVYFHDLFWRLWGMPTNSKVDAATTKRDITNYQYEINQAKRKVAELRNAGKDDEADNIVLQWEARGENVEPGKRSYDRFDTSSTERMFNTLSPTGQERFEEQVYPSK